MKSRAEALDTSLDSLKASFQSISQLSASLAPPNSSPTTVTATSRPAPPQPPSAAPATPTRRRLSALAEDPPTPTPNSTNAAELTVPPLKTKFDPLVHLPALLSLPVLLRSLLVTERSKADSLWGTWEPALRSWEDEKVEGVREIGMECREVLKSRRASGGARSDFAGR